MKKLRVGLYPLVSNINLPTVITTAILPGEFTEKIFIATQVGEILYLENNKKPVTFLDISSRVIEFGTKSGYDERGLLGLAFHPRFNNNGLFYLHYSLRGTQGNGALDYSFVPDPSNPNTINMKWDNREKRYDHIDTIEEWIVQNNGQITKRRTLLNIRRPFMNHNGVNSLKFSLENGKLLFLNGDGGSGYDPFNLAQDDLEIAGKIIEIDVDKQVFVTLSPIVSRFNEIPIPLQKIMMLLAKGIRNNVGLTYQLINNNYIKYIGNAGQDLVESIFVVDQFIPIPVTDLVQENYAPPKNFTNFGWRGWEGIYPTAIFTNEFENTNQLLVAYYNESVKLSQLRLIPLISYYHHDSRPQMFEGNCITSVVTYMGDSMPDLKDKIIFSDFFNSKISRMPRGILAYTNPRGICKENEYSEIEIDDDFNSEPAFFVSLGTNNNHSKLYLGVYGSANVTDFNAGTVYEIIALDEN